MGMSEGAIQAGQKEAKTWVWEGSGSVSTQDNVRGELVLQTNSSLWP